MPVEEARKAEGPGDAPRQDHRLEGVHSTIRISTATLSTATRMFTRRLHTRNSAAFGQAGPPSLRELVGRSGPHGGAPGRWSIGVFAVRPQDRSGEFDAPTAEDGSLSWTTARGIGARISPGRLAPLASAGKGQTAFGLYAHGFPLTHVAYGNLLCGG